jgi:hypothetical protein
LTKKKDILITLRPDGKRSTMTLTWEPETKRLGLSQNERGGNFWKRIYALGYFGVGALYVAMFTHGWKPLSGLYYKHVTIVNDNSSIIKK